MRLFKHELNGGDRLTVIGQWYVQTAIIGERLFVRRYKNWMGAAKPHRGDFVNSFWHVHSDGSEECLDSWGWDHYTEESYTPEPPADFHPDAFLIEPGSRLEMRSHGATFGAVELFQPVVHFWFYRDSIEARRRYAPELVLEDDPLARVTLAKHLRIIAKTKTHKFKKKPISRVTVDMLRTG